jgi:hypothetical protein
MNAVRKMRWTWAADLQPGDFVRSEFAVAVSNWTVNGSNRNYQVAGMGSWRAEDSDVSIGLYRPVDTVIGNYSGGSISYATTPGASVSYSYQSPQSHILNLGTRRFPTAAQVTVQVDQNPVQVLSVALPGEDVLVRWALGTMAGGTQHTVTITHTGAAGDPFYFDFLEIAIPTSDLPTFLPDPQTTLATDWDTLNSQASGAGADRVADPVAGIHRQVQSLCGRAVVLRVGLRGPTVRRRDDRVLRHVAVRKDN